MRKAKIIRTRQVVSPLLTLLAALLRNKLLYQGLQPFMLLTALIKRLQ
ncbi:hypothetical protein CDA65_02361 [Lacticaseibacillus paracasei]|nr:hypothetical protein [Lacticaseibacillus paracasei]POO16377.1 hypothetical protein CDA65_02361 [Lacticaseibacillus paracasei]